MLYMGGVGAAIAAPRVSGSAAALPTAGCNQAPAPQTGFFTADERTALGALANAIMPPDDQPGATDLGAVDYIERFMMAFDAATSTNPPAIYPGGPFSGRAPYADAYGQPSTSFPPNSYASFLFLSQIKEAGWRMTLYGPSALPGGVPNAALLASPVVGLRDQMKQGLQAAIAGSTTPLDQLSTDDAITYFDTLPIDFKNLLITLVSQGCFCPPEYGGNVGLKGWLMTHFPGDQLPLGYSVWSAALNRYVERSDAPMTTPDASDPEPLDNDVIGLINSIVPLLGGKVFQ